MFAHKLTDDAELILLETRHAQEIYTLIDRNRERLRRWLTFVDHSNSADTERAFIKNGLHQFANDQGFHCGIVYKGKLAGNIGMLPVDLRNRSTEIGYWLDQDAEGKGLVTTACRAFLDHCFNQMNLNRVVIRTAPGNERSQAVAKRLGAIHEGTQRQSIELQGRFIDQEVFSLLKQDWPSASTTDGLPFFTHELDEDTRLSLLDSTQADAVFHLADENREHLRRWLPWVDDTRSANDIQAFIEDQLHQFAENGTTVTGIWHHGVLAGSVGIHYVSVKCMEIGYWLGENHQRKGLVTKACRALIHHAFAELGMNRIEIRVEPRNPRSIAIPERLGFTCEGTLRGKGMNADGKFIDLMMYSLLKSDIG
jgi:ribosomal-protein-serine acetyltransferase